MNMMKPSNGRKHATVNTDVSKNEEDNALSQESDVDGENNEIQSQNNSSEITDIPQDEATKVSDGSKSTTPFVLKHEKPKLPTFNGDACQYFIFKSDFQHTIEAHCTEIMS